MNTFLSREEVMAIGFKSVGENVLIGRTVMFYHPHLMEIGNNVRIDDFCTMSGKIILGSYIHISHFCSLYGGDSGITLEDYTAISSKSSVYAVSDDYSGESMTNPMIPLEFRPHLVDKAVVFKKHAIVGASSVVMPGVTLGEGCAVGSMSLVLKDLDAWTINVGTPCKKIRMRSKNIINLEKDFAEKRK